jgi:purine-nucleoside phosphorylase
VECIIRIGTAGAYTNNLKVYDVINVDNAFSESTFAKCAFNMDGDFIPHQGVAFEIINKVAASISQPLIAANIHSSDVFYRSNPAVPAIAAANNCVAVEMEAFALFANAKYLNKMAATIITVSDIIPTHEGMTTEQRETSLRKMYELALESTIAIHATLENK